MAEIDTSSYKLPAAPNALDTIGKYQGLESNKLAIDKQKLDLVNQGLQYMTREINSVDPTTATPEDFFRIGQRAVNMKFMTPEIYSEFIKEIPTDKAAIPKFVQEYNNKAKSMGEIIQWHYGDVGTATDNKNIYQTRTSQKPGFGVQIDPNPIVTTKLPGTTQIPDTEPTLPDGKPNPTYGQPRFNAPAGGPLVTPQQQQRQPLPAQQPSFNNNFPGGDPLAGARTPNQLVQSNFPAMGPPSTMPPNYEEGKKRFLEDQDLATQKLTALKPALQALPLIRNLTTGIGTDTYNKALAGLSNLGFLPEGATGKVADYQVINKKLADYLRSSPLAARSDAAQTLSQSASPDPKGQINKALVKLTQDAIALDRVQAARAHGFLDDGGNSRNDYQNYINHRSKFPPSMDERAFGFDAMIPSDRKELLVSMNKKLNSSKASERNEALKFKKSLEIVDKLGYLDLSLD